MMHTTSKLRHARRATAVLVALTANAALSAIGAAAVSPGSAPRGPAAAGSSVTRPCTGRGLALRVPSGDPYVAEGMDRVRWTAVVTNTSAAGCTVTGFPAFGFSAAGRTLGVRQTRLPGSDEFTVAPGRVALAAGSSAAVSVLAAADGGGCRTTWQARLNLPDGSRVTASTAPDGFGPCGSATIGVTAFYPLARLTGYAAGGARAAAAMRPGAAPCSARDLRAQAQRTVARARAELITVDVSSATGRTCALGSFWPAVRLRGDTSSNSGGDTAKAAWPAAVYKVQPLLAATGGATAALLAAYSPVVVEIAVRTRGTGCRTARQLALYPLAFAAGASATVSLPTPVRYCGAPRVLPFLKGRAGAAGAEDAAAFGALTASPTVSGAGDSSGYVYGSDTNAPVVGGSAPYSEPVPSGHVTEGRYGFYGAEVGNYFNWQGCGAGHNVPTSQNVHAANTNLVTYATGVGTAAYWMLAGAGADPHYNGTTTEASSFGASQAARVVALVNANGSAYWTNQMLYADIENTVTTGWDARWNGKCGGYGGSEIASSVPSLLDLAVFTGFMSYVYNNSAYFAGVYCAGGSSGQTWSEIFGALAYPASNSQAGPEWTYTNGTSSLATYPSAWSVPGSVSAVFYGGVASSSTHAGLWQWSGGGGTSNGYGDFDQINANSLAGQNLG